MNIHKRGSAYDARMSFSKLDFSALKDWSDDNKIKQGFKKVRDYRFLSTPKDPNFLRRSSWLYPDDGCFARASLMRENLETWSYPEVKKVFIFGNLEVKTNNSPAGAVSWWYHVVPLVKLGNEAYVFDPAIDPKEPLKLKDWVLTMVTNAEDAEYSICGQYSYTPFSDCLTSVAADDTRAKKDQMDFLDYEWDRVVELKRDPNEELGNNPPW